MVIDTSAVIELIVRGPRVADVRAAMISAAASRAMSSANLLEAHIVVRRRVQTAASSARLDQLIRGFGIEIVAFDEALARTAIDAFAKYGQGAGGGALNFGDCFAYALAKQRNEPLLFIGSDFRRTDIASVLQ